MSVLLGRADRDRRCRGWFRNGWRDRGDETVAAAGERFDEARRFRRIAKRLAHFLDRGVEPVLEIDERVGFPQPFAELFAGDDLAGAREQRLEHLTRLLLQPHAAALVEEFPGAHVELEPVEPDAV